MADDSENGHYRKVFSGIWDKTSFAGLGRDEKLVALYLLTAPQVNRIGLYKLSMAMAADEHLGMDKAALVKSIHTVCDTFGWGFDEGTRTVYLTSWWRYNPPANPKHLDGALKDLGKVPESPFIERFKHNTDGLTGTVLDTFAERYGIPRPNQQQQQEQHQEQERKQQQQQGELPLAAAEASASAKALPAAEVRRLTMVRELELCGVDAAKRVGLAGQLIRRGATPIVVRRMWRESQRMATRNPTGYLLSKLGDANGGGPSLAPGPTDLGKVVAAVERGEVVAIFGYPVRPGWVTHHAERRQIAIYDRPADGGTCVNAFVAGELTDWDLTLSGHALPAKKE